MDTAFRQNYRPFADAGQLVGLLPLGVSKPDRFFRVIANEPVPTIQVTIAASASNERQQTLEVAASVLIQWRFIVITALAQVVLRSPRAARSYATGGGGQGFVADLTETDWGSETDRSPTEFFFLGGEQEEIRFDNLTATAATDTRFTGWKHFLESKVVETWLMTDPNDSSKLLSVDPVQVTAEQLHLLQNFAGIVPLALTRK